MKVSSIAAGLTALLALSLPACQDTHGGEHKEHAEHAEHAEHGEHGEQHKIVVTNPEAKEVKVTQQYVCQIHSRKNTKICARAFGILEEIKVQEGQAVKEGEVLFRVNPLQYEARYNAELQEYNVAKLEYENTEALANKTIGNNPIVSQRELMIYKAKMDKAKGNVDRAQVELTFATVRAPYDGVIDRQEMQQGSTVKEGEVLTTISDNRVMWVYFNVPEGRDLEFRAAVGSDGGPAGEDLKAYLNRTAKVELMLANGSKYPIPGTISSIGATVNNETGNRRYRADFPNPSGVLCHGRTGNVLISRMLPDALVIPQRATFERLDKRYVFVVDKDDVAHERLITIASELEDVFVVKSGLAPADRIVLEGVRQVHEGQKLNDVKYHKPSDVNAHLKHRAE